MSAYLFDIHSREVIVAIPTGPVRMSKSGNTPANYLEAAVVGCLGLGILEWSKKAKCIYNPFVVSVRIGGNVLHIDCSCDDIYKEQFLKIVEDCYISAIVNLEKQVKFK